MIQSITPIRLPMPAERHLTPYRRHLLSLLGDSPLSVASIALAVYGRDPTFDESEAVSRQLRQMAQFGFVAFVGLGWVRKGGAR